MRSELTWLCGLLLVYVSTYAQGAVTDAQLEALTDRIDALQRELAELKRVHAEETLALQEEVIVVSELQDIERESQQSGVDVNLYATIEYENFSGANKTFDARNVELIVSGRSESRLQGMAEIEFERTAVTSGGNRAGEVEVEQGWLQYDISPMLNPRMGVILVPFGRYNIDHFDVLQELSDRPIAMRRVVPTTWAEAGFGSVGGKSLGGLRIGYEAYLLNGLTDAISDRGFRDARGAFGSDNNNDPALAGRFTVERGNQQFGVSLYQGQYDNSADIFGFDIDMHVEVERFEFIGEYVRFSLDDGLTQSGFAPPEVMSGGYAQLSWRFWPQSFADTFLGLGFEQAAMRLIGRYDWASIDDDGDVGIGSNREKRFTLGINYRPTQSYALKCEYQWNSSSGEALERGDSDGLICSATAVF